MKELPPLLSFRCHFLFRIKILATFICNADWEVFISVPFSFSFFVSLLKSQKLIEFFWAENIGTALKNSNIKNHTHKKRKKLLKQETNKTYTSFYKKYFYSNFSSGNKNYFFIILQEIVYMFLLLFFFLVIAFLFSFSSNDHTYYFSFF